MQFNRISVTKKGVELAYERADEHKVEEIKATSSERPLPSFADAMQAFSPFVIDLLEIPDDWQSALTITTLNLSADKNGNRGLIVTATKPVAKAYDRPLVLNTPLVREGGDEPADEACVLPDEVLELIALAEDEAVRYLNGEREQRELFEGSSENVKQVDERMAAAEVASTRKPKRGKGKTPKQGDTGVAIVANEAGEPLDDDGLRQLLLSVERDVPIDAINLWTSSDRDAAQRWATARQKQLVGQAPDGAVPTEPECVANSATLPIMADDWTEAAPVRVNDEAVQEIAASVESSR
jgi:hypothetical protein